MFLQLLAVLLAMLALAGPRMRGSSGQGQRFVFLIDNSASMSATDVAPTRLAEAKKAAKKVVSEMDADDLAMVITFCRFGEGRVELHERSPRPAASDRRDRAVAGADLAAGRAAGGGGAGQSSKQIGEGVVASSVVTPKLFIYTDGGFPDVEGFSLGNLEPEVVVIGPPFLPTGLRRPAASPGDPENSATNPSDNVGIMALQTRRDEDKPDIYQLFGRVHNFRSRGSRDRGPALPTSRPASRPIKPSSSTRSRSRSPHEATSRSSSTCRRRG